MKTTLAIVFVLLSFAAFAQDKETAPNKSDIRIDQPLPLFIVDGFPTSQAELNLINPDNIASMKVMKAKEAVVLFGDQGRNGAVIVTTKKAKQTSEHPR